MVFRVAEPAIVPDARRIMAPVVAGGLARDKAWRLAFGSCPAAEGCEAPHK